MIKRELINTLPIMQDGANTDTNTNTSLFPTPSMLPTSSRTSLRPPPSPFLHLLTRTFHLSQMDFTTALDTMSMLASTDPQTAYKESYYRKQTKDHWSRDDPAFLVLQTFLHLISTICYSVAFNLSFLSSLRLFVTNVAVHVAGGFVISELMRHMANTHLLTHRTHSVKQVRGGGGGGLFHTFHFSLFPFTKTNDFCSRARYQTQRRKSSTYTLSIST